MSAKRTTDESHYDTIVVGSGFGGSVMTYRLREAGQRICLLERGRPYPPGSFPRSPHEFSRAFWDPSEGLYGMYNVWSFEHSGAVVSSGLGGGSLIYANVLLRKDPAWFVRDAGPEGGHESWPVTREELDPHYERAERMLDAQPFPFEHPPYDRTPRTRAFFDAARSLGWEAYTPNLAVTFANRGDPPVTGEPIREAHPNLHGRTRTTCRLCGECDIGCNYGSKNTLDYNYLSEAARLGAEIHTFTEVRTFAPREGGGWLVGFVRHEPEREGQPFDTATLPLETISADRLVVSAGTLGTTYLMLRNLPRLPRMLGTRFSGNGDLLTLAMNASQIVDGERIPRIIEAGRGPTITAAVRFPDEVEGGDGRGFYLEDVGYPEFLNWMLQVVETPGALWRWRTIALRLLWALLRRERETDVSAEVAALLGDTRLSAGMMPLAGMGRDVPDGLLRLRGDRLEADWRIDRSDAYFRRVRGAMERFADALGGSFRDNPLWHFGQRVITVHPLGGCPMGRDEREGVVSPYGEVYGYPGLYVADGSVMPGPVGPNPSLTIAALADRFADRIALPAGA
ncbi:MAG TPA: GMC family oxidoreductase [Candidatus Limnocylindrales bacterium]|jgi:cholesterol oxidase|nr:GMC family oxidoreductase [Candidatus Limnocylindrales bacterium]